MDETSQPAAVLVRQTTHPLVHLLLQSLLSPELTIGTATAKSPDNHRDMSEAFSKTKVRENWNHPPRTKVYPLSLTGQKAMEDLNQCMVRYRHPSVPAALEQLRNAQFLTNLHIREGDEWKTAFSTTSGHCESCVMPYGISRLINDVLRDYLRQFVIAFIDDILVYSPSFTTHVDQVLQRLSQHQLYVNGEKCEFHPHIISFLGCIISPEGVSMDQSRVPAAVDWPTPQNCKDQQRFLGIANFYQDSYGALVPKLILSHLCSKGDQSV